MHVVHAPVDEVELWWFTPRDALRGSVRRPVRASDLATADRALLVLHDDDLHTPDLELHVALADRYHGRVWLVRTPQTEAALRRLCAVLNVDDLGHPPIEIDVMALGPDALAAVEGLAGLLLLRRVVAIGVMGDHHGAAGGPTVVSCREPLASAAAHETIRDALVFAAIDFEEEPDVDDLDRDEFDAADAPADTTDRDPDVTDDEVVVVAAPVDGDEPPAGSAKPGASPLTPLTVRLLHGSLEYASNPLVIGHVQGLPLSGAEERIDRCLDGRLTELRMLRRYADQIGDAVVIDNDPGLTPEYILVVGLGTVGSLTPTKLRETLTAGFLELARESGRRHRRSQTDDVSGSANLPPSIPVKVSLVTIGSSEATGIGVEASVRAAVAALADAQDKLNRTITKYPAPAFVEIEFVERYADRVELLARALWRVASGPGDVAATISFDGTVAVMDGASSGSAAEDTASAWRRLDITSSRSDPAKPTIFTYTSMGARARAEVQATAVNPEIVKPMLAASIGNDSDPQITRALFELLVPHTMKDELASGGNVHLVVDRTTAYVPWELLTPEGSDYQPATPLALRNGVLRQFREVDQMRFTPRRSLSQQALVIGNPPTSNEYVSLPGAAQEASSVASVLERSGWATTAAIWDEQRRQISSADIDFQPNPSTWLQCQLVSNEWRIVHVAAHGQIGDTADTTGIVLDNTFITAEVFRSMAYVPDLVFLNACHAGSITTSLGRSASGQGWNEIAASVAQTLLQVGVRAVVVAGWAVSDRPAEAFAAEFYEAMLEQHMDFGDAVAAARRAARAANSRKLTWGAYQCYGDAGFRLSSNWRRWSSRAPVTDAERRRRIEQIVVRSGEDADAVDADGVTLAGQLDALAVPQRATRNNAAGAAPALVSAAALSQSAEVLADLARAYGELGEFEKAINFYRAALAKNVASASIGSVEQLANLLVRAELERVLQEAEPVNRPTVNESAFDEARRLLGSTLAISETAERLGLVGSLAKKRAVLAGEDRSALVAEAIGHYRRAAVAAPSDHYGTTLVHLCCAARIAGVAIDDEPDTTLMDEWLSARATGTGFWGSAARGDVALARGLLKVAGGSSVELPLRLIGDAYLAAFRLRSTWRQRESVIAHVRDLAELLSGTAAGMEMGGLVALLKAWPAPR